MEFENWLLKRDRPAKRQQNVQTKSTGNTRGRGTAGVSKRHLTSISPFLEDNSAWAKHVKQTLPQWKAALCVQNRSCPSVSTLTASASAAPWTFYKHESRSCCSSSAPQTFLGLLVEAPLVMLTFAVRTHVRQEMDRDTSKSFPVGSQTAALCEGQSFTQEGRQLGWGVEFPYCSPTAPCLSSFLHCL